MILPMRMKMMMKKKKMWTKIEKGKKGLCSVSDPAPKTIHIQVLAI
jgi:hypothetical protein